MLLLYSLLALSSSGLVAGYKGKHGAKWLREEELTEQFARLYKSIQVPKSVVEEITATLRTSHRDKTQFHRTMLESYQREYQKYETRIEKMYEDKLDGRITESEYSKKREGFRAKQNELNEKIYQIDQCVLEEDREPRTRRSVTLHVL